MDRFPRKPAAERQPDNGASSAWKRCGTRNRRNHRRQRNDQSGRAEGRVGDDAAAPKKRALQVSIEHVTGSRSAFITILIAHRISTIRHADKILVLRKGRIVEHGNHLELMRQKRLYCALWQQIGSERDGYLIASATVSRM